MQADLESPERGVRHRGVAGRWLLAVDLLSNPFLKTDWLSKKDLEVRRMCPLLVLSSVGFSAEGEMRLLMFFLCLLVF